MLGTHDRLGGGVVGGGTGAGMDGGSCNGGDGGVLEVLVWLNSWWVR